MDITIRAVEPADYAEVVSLWNNELDDPRVTVENIGITYEKMKQRGVYDTFVAVSDGSVVGMITIVEVLAVGFPVGYIKLNGVAVKTEHQGKGVGRKLLDYIESVARQRGCSFIGLATGVKRTEAHKVYEHLGYRSGSYWYNKILK